MATFDFMSTKLAHQQWRVRLRLFLDGVQQLSTAEATSARDCALGHWLYGGAMEKYGNVNEMHELERIHTSMHNLVREVIEAQSAGKAAEAEAKYMEMSQISEKIIGLLDVIERQVG